MQSWPKFTSQLLSILADELLEKQFFKGKITFTKYSGSLEIYLYNFCEVCGGNKSTGSALVSGVNCGEGQRSETGYLKCH